MSKIIGAPSCETCKFLVAEMGQFYCRRNPPHAQIVMQMTQEGPRPMTTLSVWPPVQSDQWCGEHRTRLAH